MRIDAVLEDRGGLEHHHPPGRDRNFLASLGVAPDPLALPAHHEGAEGRKLHRLPAFEAIGDFLQDQFDQRRRFGARQAYLLIDRLAQISPCDRLARHRLPHSAIHIPLFFQTIFAWSEAVNGAGGADVGKTIYHRSSAAPQVKPPPMASKSTRSPRLMRRSATASASASGIEAADVLPWRSSVITTFSGAMPSLCAEPSMMRLLA